MKKVLVWGTFDILHLGHMNFLNQAKSQGDWLVVLVARDKIVEKIKGRRPLHSETDRQEMLKNVKAVDEAILDREEEDLEAVKKIMPNVVCLGYDQSAYTEGLEERLKQAGVNAQIIRLSSHKPQSHKSSKIKQSIKATY